MYCVVVPVHGVITVKHSSINVGEKFVRKVTATKMQQDEDFETSGNTVVVYQELAIMNTGHVEPTCILYFCITYTLQI